MYKGDLRLHPTDYESSAPNVSLSFREMESVLDEVNCKKLLFVDACHSGGAGAIKGSKYTLDPAEVQSYLYRYNLTPNGLIKISSCREAEVSFENEKWKNGAFTEGIIRGLGRGEADRNKNKVITVNELYAYLKKQVPSLVRSLNQDYNQNPKMFPESINYELPLYIHTP